MNPVLQKIMQTQQVMDHDGKPMDLHSNISDQAGQMFQKWIRKVDCVNAVEVGLAFGVSSLYILDELTNKVDAKHYGIDPMQYNDRWHGLGLENIKRAGFEGNYEFFHEPSFAALPKIYETGNRFQFAFIDGWHTFDYTLVDFFFIDKILDQNGVIAFDDVGYKAVRKAISFVLSNLEYKLVDGVKFDISTRKSLKSRIKSNLSVLSRDDWTPSPQSREKFNQLDGMQSVVLQKLSDDVRSFNHFTAF